MFVNKKAVDVLQQLQVSAVATMTWVYSVVMWF